MIDRATIAKILDAADIVDVVSEFVTLKKAGANYKGLCPFHSDKTPSFSVSPARNYCHCFSCGKGGTPVGFIMEHEQMTYPEALRWLAKHYHIEIKEKELTSEEREQESERESMFIVNEWVAQYYHGNLYNDVDGRAIGMQYFRSRGFRDDIIKKFRLGFALDNRYAMPREAMGKGYKMQYLLKTGLCYAVDNDRQSAGGSGATIVDRFAGRAIFPWIGMSGKVVAFGGRKLDKETKGVAQKYVNSPDSDIYHKDHELYGIYQAKKAIGKEDRVFMVEGYTDVISMHQCGIENVVANSGTALSQHQIHTLHRLTKNIVLLYDGDAAGVKAALRGTDMLLSEGMNVKVLFLPDGDDPDSFARKHSAQEFRDYVEAHLTDFIQFKIEVSMKGVTDPVKRSQAVSSIIESVSKIPDPIIRHTYLQECASRLHMPEKTLLTQMNRFISDSIKRRRSADDRQQYQSAEQNAQGSTSSASSSSSVPPPPSPDDYPPPPTPDDFPPGPGEQATGPAPSVAGATNATATRQPSASTVDGSPLEMMLLETIVRHGEEILYADMESEDGQKYDYTVAEYIYANLQADDIEFHNPVARRIMVEAVEHSHQEGFFAAPFFSQHPDITVSSLAANLLVERYTLSKSLEMVHTCEWLQQHIEKLLLGLRRELIDSKLKDILQQIASCSGDHDKAMRLMEEFRELKQLSTSLAKKLGSNLR